MTSTTIDAQLRRRAFWCAAAFSLLVVPNVAAVVTPFERWPFTCGPMFAENPGARVRYDASFVLEHDDGTTTPLAARKAIGLSESQFRRAFLVHGWGSDDDGSFLAFANDDDDARAGRVAAFFDGVVAVALNNQKQEWSNVVAVRVDIVEVGAAGDVVVGVYAVKDRSFVIAPRWRR